MTAKDSVFSAFRGQALWAPFLAWACFLAFIGASRAAAAAAPQPEMVLVPAGEFTPLLKTAGEAATVQVPCFQLDSLPVTNAQYLEFVRTHPQWRRSRVARLFADTAYLRRWTDDLILGSEAPPDAPVVNVSWFAARAYAASLGKRLPTAFEWERAASFGYTEENWRRDKAFKSDLYRWLSIPAPAVLPSLLEAKANRLGIRGLFGFIWEWVDDFDSVLVTEDSRSDSGPLRSQYCGSGSSGAQDPGDYAAFMRLALRSSLRASNTTESLGFRCARDASIR